MPPLQPRAILVSALLAATLALGWSLARVNGAWEAEAIERGYGELCPLSGNAFAWKGECGK